MVAALILPATRADDVNANLDAQAAATKPALRKPVRAARVEPHREHARKSASPPRLAEADCDPAHPADGAACGPDAQSLTRRLDQALDKAFPPDEHDPALDPPY